MTGTADREARTAVLRVLGKRGFPTTMMTPAGVMPAVVVWMEMPEAPELAMLTRAFGGHLVLEMRNHHGEESPAFWIGVGRAAVLALGVVQRAAARDAGSELMGAGAPAGWQALEEMARLRLRPAGAATADEVERCAQRVDALVSAAFHLAAHITGGLNTAMTGVLRSERFAVDLSLPTLAERDTWADAFLAPLREPGCADPEPA